MFDRILVPTDGSAVADAAADAALELCDRLDASLHVINVLEPGELQPGPEDEGADELARHGENATATIEEMATAAGVEVTTSVIETAEPTYRAILTYVDEHDIDCLVMGTHGRTGLDRLVLGSVAERTLREAPVPVLTVHEETVTDSLFDSILVPTDGSSCAEAAASYAIDLAAMTGGALHLVHVVDTGILADNPSAGMVLDALEEEGQRALDRLIEQAEDADVSTIEAAVLNGRPHRAIAQYAAENDVDSVVMGTHGRSGLDRYLLGSVTERVVRGLEVPVLAIREESADEEGEAKSW